MKISAFLTFFLSFVWGSASPAVMTLEFMHDCVLPTGTRIGSSEVAGLSALQWDEKKKLLIALSDLQKSVEPQIFYFQLLGPDGMCPVPSGVMFLDGPINADTVDQRLKTDGEGLALDSDGSFYVSSESATASERNDKSEVIHISEEGLEIENVALPIAFLPNEYYRPPGPEPIKLPLPPPVVPPVLVTPSAPPSLVGKVRWAPVWVEKTLDYIRKLQWKRQVQSAKDEHRRHVERLHATRARIVKKIEDDFKEAHKMWVDNHAMKKAGTQFNAGVEALSFDPKLRILSVMAESSLHQDQIFGGDINRLERLILNPKGQVIAGMEFFYRVDAKMRVSEIADLGSGNLLVLEVRYESILNKVHARIYEISLGQSSGQPSVIFLEKAPSVIAKRLVLDLDSIVPQLSPAFPRLDNLEGMAVGPRLASGERTLILVSDNNENFKQTNQFLFFKLKP